MRKKLALGRNTLSSKAKYKVVYTFCIQNLTTEDIEVDTKKVMGVFRTAGFAKKFVREMKEELSPGGLWESYDNDEYVVEDYNTESKRYITELIVLPLDRKH